MAVWDPGLSDVTYTGIDDTGTGFSGPSTNQDVSVLGSPLQLDTSSGLTDLSSYDFWTGSDPSATLGLSGVSDPPFASQDFSTPNPGGSGMSWDTSSALNALTKFGASFATLLGNHPTTMQATPVPYSVMQTNPQPTIAANGTSLSILLIVGAALFLLIAWGGE